MNKYFFRALQRANRILPGKLQFAGAAQIGHWAGKVDDELRYCMRYVPMDRRRLAIDVGSNNGVTSYWLAKVFESVDSFEANAELMSEWSRFACSNIRAHAIAVSNVIEQRTLTIPVVNELALTGWASLDAPLLQEKFHSRTIVVDTCRLDDQIDNKQNVDLIKIDVEGHEIEVVLGAVNTIRRCLPWLIIEVVDRNRRQMNDILFEVGYQIATASELNLNRIAIQNVVYKPPKLDSAR